MMQKLTIEQKDYIQKAIEQKCPYVCNGCRKGDFTLLPCVITDKVTDGVVTITKDDNPFIKFEPINVPKIMIFQFVYNICDNCGLVRQHSLKQFDIYI